ncbi:MAG TPA: aspartate--tRNA ligase [Thermoanaerobaculia bacterium]|nr:aspartate--tRNA ligase [Thermoanaerobaculia bacterium]
MTQNRLNDRLGAGAPRREDAGKRITLSGWVHKQRDFGELIFIDLRDRTGLCQIVVDQNRVTSADVVAAAKELRSEYVVQVTGMVAERAEDRRNPKLGTGDVEVVAEEIVILNRAETPPFAIEDDTSVSEELRLQYRYLDLRRPELTKNLILRDRVSFLVRDYLHRNGFLEVETPILTKSTPEGARDFLVPSRVNRGQFYALPQSPQLFKQLLMVSGLERYYQMAKCFRDEDLRSDRQPEFTQIDIEASFIDEEFIYSLIEGLFEAIFPAAGIEVKTPFPRMTWAEALDRYGIDRPDTRFGMELIDLAAAGSTIDFPPFRDALSSGGLVRGIVVPGGAALSRKRIDDLTAYAKQFRAGGLIWIKFDEQKSSSMKKFLDDASFEKLREAAGARAGDMLLIVAGRKTIVQDALANLRLRVAREENLIPEGLWNFLWITDFPLFELDDETGRYFARHHPFTSPAGDPSSIGNDRENALARAYDVVLNGLELGGGSIRINDTQVQQTMFTALGVDADEAMDRFGFLLDAFRYGAPPHGGVALGLDRIIMMMAGAGSIRDVIAFPKTTSAQDLMTAAPSAVDPAQLNELGLELKQRRD